MKLFRINSFFPLVLGLTLSKIYDAQDIQVEYGNKFKTTKQ